MIVREMHVDIRDQTQHLSGNRNRKLLDEHIDWYLNRSQLMLIESAVESIKGSGRYQIKPNKHSIVDGITVNRLSLSAAWRGEKYMSILPPNFLYLLDDGSQVTQLCSGDTKTIGHEVLNITRVPFPYSTASSNLYNTLQLTYAGNSIFNINTLLTARQKIWTGLSAQDAHFYVKDLMIQELTKLGIKVYWEKFDTFEFPFHLIFVSTGTPVSINLNVDGASYSGTNQELSTEIHSGSRPSVLSPNSMVSSDKEIATSQTPYFKTSYISPISEKGDGVIYIHGHNSYIVYNLTINYIRKPAQISLSLGTNCELSVAAHQQLCNTAAEMIANRIGDEQWQPMTEQNKIITQ